MAHTCGHDLHTAMLSVTAAQILLENKADIHGRVKLMFQPGEEIFAGAKDMIEAGILENPQAGCGVCYAYGIKSRCRKFLSFIMDIQGHISCDNFKITITGKGALGAYPHTFHRTISDAGVDHLSRVVVN